MSRRECTIRNIRQTLDEQQMLRDWIYENREKNKIDPDLLTYRATSVLVADGRDFKGPQLMMPVQTVFVMEAIAPNPLATPHEIAVAIRKMRDVVEWESRKAGHGEIWFVASEPTIAAYAEKHENFIEMKDRVFKMKIDAEVGQ